MRAAFVLFVLATAAQAQDELYQTVWIVGEDGGLLGWPDPEAGEKMEQTFKPVPFLRGSPLELFGQAPYALSALLVPGPLDLASFCDIERHLRKTNQLAFDENIGQGISPYEETGPVDRSSPLVRRALLDRLLLIRIAARRGLKDAVANVERVAGSERVDPITRLAARDTAAMLQGRKPPLADLPPLEGVPADAGILVVVDQRRIPPWRDLWRLLGTQWVRDDRRTLARVGNAATPADLCLGQWCMDWEYEGPYELARRFGNARIHRTVVALRFPEGKMEIASAKVFLRCDGIFEVDRFRDACASLGARPTTSDKGVSVRFEDVDVTETSTRLVASRRYPVPAEGGAIPADLAKLGLGGDDAIWIHCVQVPFADRLPVEGIESLTIRAKFDGGVTVRAEGRFRDEASARKAAAALEGWTPDVEPLRVREADLRAVVALKGFLKSQTVSLKGTTVAAEWSAKGETPESLLAGVIDLQALYGSDEGD